MTAYAALLAFKDRRTNRSFVALAGAGVIALVTALAGFISYVLWPTWPSAAVPLDAPSIPIVIADVLFEIPPAAIRTAVQRHPGAHERVDLAFVWPSLTPPEAESKTAPLTSADKNPVEAIPGAPLQRPSGRLFVSIAALGTGFPPAQRLRNIYPRYVEAEALAGVDGLAILPFRAGTPYQGEDLIYLAGQPEQFFARCTRTSRVVPGTCLHERAIANTDVTMRFPRDWLDDWRSVAAGFDRLLAQLHHDDIKR
jgi:hypothetical protein